MLSCLSVIFFFLGGFLLPGNNKLGTLRWKGKLYICSTADRAEQFGSEPDLFIQGVRGLVHRHSVMEQLLIAEEDQVLSQEEDK